MIINRISVDWVMPEDDFTELPKFVLKQELIVNGYAIECGFITDGATIPFGARDSFNPLGRGFPAAIAHDHRCVNKLPRKEANELFYRDLLTCGVVKIKARIMYIAVETYRIVRGIK